MKACVCERYGGPGVVSVRERPMPQPRANEVLVRIAAATVSSGDSRLRAMRLPPGLGLFGRLAFGVWRPRRPVFGMDLAGVVAAVGAGVTRFAPGDRVVGFPRAGFDCHAAFRAVAEDDDLVPIPAGLGFEQAAALPFGGMTAVDFLRRAALRPGERMLVVGASGAVGCALVQLGRHFGAEVTGVAGPANQALVASLGADRVLDHTATDITQGGERFDVIADTVGIATFARYRPMLRPGGRLLAVAAGLPDMFAMAWAHRVTGLRVVAGPAKAMPGDLARLVAWAGQGVLRPVIDRCYPMAEIAAAHAHVDTGHKRGSVVLRIAGEGEGG